MTFGAVVAVVLAASRGGETAESEVGAPAAEQLGDISPNLLLTNLRAVDSRARNRPSHVPLSHGAPSRSTCLGRGYVGQNSVARNS